MRPNRLRELLPSGRPVVNAWVSADSSYLAEVLSHSGFDCVTVDLQHGMFGLDRAIALLQAVSAGPAVPMARCPDLDPATIGKLLDAGAYAIICPTIDTPEDAETLARACRYPPRGSRSYGPSRGLLYGGPDYTDHADDTVLSWAMIESRQALDNLDAILATSIDAVYVGPNDLALSLGERPGAAEPGPRVLDALGRIADSARQAGKYSGVFCADAGLARRMLDLGFGMVTPGNDIGILRAAAAQRVAAVRGSAPGTSGTSANGGY